MPVVEVSVVVPVPPEVAFAVSQTTGAVRLRWDPFIQRQYFLGGAIAPARGVQTYTKSRRGPAMVSEYVSYRPPSNVGMRMVTGPWFFARMAGGWRFDPDPAGTKATWRYNFSCRPRAIIWVAEPIGSFLLGRDMRRRITGFARGCEDPEVLAATRPAPGQSVGG